MKHDGKTMYSFGPDPDLHKWRLPLFRNETPVGIMTIASGKNVQIPFTKNNQNEIIKAMLFPNGKPGPNGTTIFESEVPCCPHCGEELKED